MVDVEAVRWAYRLIMGREAESEAALVRTARACASIDDVRAAFLASDEFREKNGVRVPVAGRFRSEAEGAPRLCVIGNCQGPEIARHLACITGLPVTGRDVTHYRPAGAAAWLADCEEAALILTIPLSERFDGLQVPQLEARYPGRVRVMNAPFFEGLFPDIVFLGEMGHRLPGPMDGHSKLTLRAYLRRETVESCVRSFTPSSFERHGYFAAWQASTQELIRRDAQVDVPLGDVFFAHVRTVPLLLTVNHPTTALYRIICDEICRTLDLPHRDVPLASMATAQAYWPVWPIFDALADYHRLAYRTPQIFVREHEAWSLPHFVGRSFEVYDRLGRDPLLAALRAKPSPVYDDLL